MRRSLTLAALADRYAGNLADKRLGETAHLWMPRHECGEWTIVPANPQFALMLFESGKSTKLIERIRRRREPVMTSTRRRWVLVGDASPDLT